MFEWIEFVVLFMEGDIVLKFNGKMCMIILDFDVMYGEEVLDVVIVCECEELYFKLLMVLMDDVEMDYVVLFCGVILYWLY